MRTGGRREAEANFKRALAMGDPEVATKATYQLAALALKEGDVRKARKLLKNAAASDVPDVAARSAYGLGLLQPGVRPEEVTLLPLGAGPVGASDDRNRKGHLTRRARLGRWLRNTVADGAGLVVTTALTTGVGEFVKLGIHHLF